MVDTTEVSNESEATPEEQELLREEESDESIISSIKKFGETVIFGQKVHAASKQYLLDIHVQHTLNTQVINYSLLVLVLNSHMMVLK